MTAGAGQQPDILVAVDFETAGFSAHSACAVGLARIEHGHVGATFYSLIRPPSSRVRFTHIHGLTWPMLKDAPTFAQVWPRMATFFAGTDAFLAHNAPFDRRVLHASCQAVGVPCPAMPFLCTLKGARAGLPLPSKKLSCCCEYFAIPLNHHNACSDATACAELYLRLRGLGITDAQMRL